ncbi:hypothetical protein [Thermococcus sp.]|uniref:hypothetical protein n=1 Tax=Thermococcus sp. TaxID=35749 RepID=UPI0026284715|nr:hypothetical protein [Thermococcus sp.]
MRAMVLRLLGSILLSALLSFTAWIILQLSSILGLVLFVSAVFLPLYISREYYRKKPRTVIYLTASLLLILLMRPPPVTGPNVAFGLYFATGCGNVDTPEGDEGFTCSCNETIAYSTVHVSGVAWKSKIIELPITGRFVTVYEPLEKAEKSYREAVESVEGEGYLKLVEDYGTYSHVIKDVLLSKGNQCVYIAETRVLGGGLAVISARGPCRGVKEFALRWHDDYLWNASEPPIFMRYRFNWSSSNGVRVGKFTPKDWPSEWVRNTYRDIAIELKGTGYVKKLEGEDGECKWSLWVRKGTSHYVAIDGKEILILSGKTENVEQTAERMSPCGLKNGWKAEEYTPEKALSLVLSELNGSFAPKPAEPPVMWSLAGEKFTLGENTIVTLLVYGTEEQCNYARYLLDTKKNTTSICLKRAGYIVTMAVKGDAKDVSVVLSSIK